MGKNVDKIAYEKQKKTNNVEHKAGNALDMVLSCVEEDHIEREKNMHIFRTEMDEKNELEKQKDERHRR